MHISFQRNSEISIAKQIAQAIADRIASGLIRDGERLPSIRSLSRQLRVSPMTVIQAYRILENEQLLIRIQGKGTFVKQDVQPNKKSQASSPYDWQLSVTDNLSRSRFPFYYHIPVEFPMSDSVIDPDLLPNLFMEQEIIKILAQDPKSISRYSDIQGDTALREAIARYLRNKQITATAEQILITNGSQQGIDLVARTFLQPGDIVVTEAPTYAAAIDLFKGQGANIHSIPVDEHGMRVDQLAHLFERVQPKLIYTIPTFQNPTGVTMSLKRRHQLLQIAQNTSTLILEDDPWSEIHFELKPPIPLVSLDQEGRVIYIKGLSKILAPSCRIGLLIASGSVFQRLVAMKGNVDLGNPLLTQKAVLSLIQTERMARHIQKLQIALQIKRDLMTDSLSRHMPEGVTWYKPSGGLNIWVSLPPHLNAEEVALEARKREVAILPGGICYPADPEPNHFRITFASLNEHKIQEGVARLGEVIASLLRFP